MVDPYEYCDDGIQALSIKLQNLKKKQLAQKHLISD